MKIKTCFFVFLALILSSCDVVAPEPTATATVTPQPTSTPSPTLTPTKTPLPTATPNIVATQQYEGFQTWVERLVTDGVIQSADGEYHSLEDFSDSLAQSAYYNWILYEDWEVTNFIIQANVKISNATTENVFKSACGFVFDDFFSNHAVFFALDGNVNYRTEGGDRGSKLVDPTLYQNPEGVTITLILNNKALFFYVNNELAFSGATVYGGPFKVGPSILSGTSEGFGTRCDFTKITLWVID